MDIIRQTFSIHNPLSSSCDQSIIVLSMLADNKESFGVEVSTEKNTNTSKLSAIFYDNVCKIINKPVFSVCHLTPYTQLSWPCKTLSSNTAKQRFRSIWIKWKKAIHKRTVSRKVLCFKCANEFEPDTLTWNVSSFIWISSCDATGVVVFTGCRALIRWIRMYESWEPLASNKSLFPKKNFKAIKYTSLR